MSFEVTKPIVDLETGRTVRELEGRVPIDDRALRVVLRERRARRDAQRPPGAT